MKFAVTCGDVNGIGPEIALKTFDYFILSNKNAKFYFFCPLNIFEYYYTRLGFRFKYIVKSSDGTEYEDVNPKIVTVIDLGSVDITPGKPNKESGSIAYESIRTAFSGAKEEKVDAVITAPISKYALKLSGIDFPGHTEMLAKWCGVEDNYVMMFIASGMKAALLTIHEPLQDISKLITPALLQKKLSVLHKSLTDDFLLRKPSIALLGLNPHAGENGLIGTEEIETIIPFIQNNNYGVEGPFAADGYFGFHNYKNYDLTVGCYHDQALIPFKLLYGNEGVNYTAGLPIIRTSPDHGTAFDLAGKGNADAGSMIKSVEIAAKIAKNRKRNIVQEYSVFSVFYKDYVKNLDFEEFAANIYTLATKKGFTGTGTVLELASGTGNFADVFKQYCYRFILSDLSFNMVNEASDHYDKAVINMTSIPCKDESIELCLSFFDSVNYLTSKSELNKFFSESARVLIKGGLLIFDTVFKKIIKNISGMVYETKEFKLERNYDSVRKIVISKFTKLDNGIPSVIELHEQRIYTYDEMLTAAIMGGFKVESVKDFSLSEGYIHSSNGNNNSERVIFILRKV